MELSFDITLSKSQQEVYDLVQDKKYKFITVVFSRQSGKTVLMLVLCIQWLLEKNMSVAYICRNFVLAKRLYKELIRVLPKEVIKSANGSDLAIETIYDSTLTFSYSFVRSVIARLFQHCNSACFHFSYTLRYLIIISLNFFLYSWELKMEFGSSHNALPIWLSFSFVSFV